VRYRHAIPLHISRLRSEVAHTGTGATSQLPQSSEVALDLAEKLPPVDRIPPESPQMTAATVEIMVSGMFRSVEDRRLTAIGILATDKRDHVYLAEEIARRRPNVLPFTIESSLVYLHPDVAGFVRGTVVASTYSLNERTQRLTDPSLAEHFSQQFGASPAHGAFNALAILLDADDRLIDYRAPRRPGAPGESRANPTPCRPQGRPDADCLPPVWISVVGRGTILPLAADTQGSAASPATTRRPRATRSVRGRPAHRRPHQMTVQAMRTRISRLATYCCGTCLDSCWC